MSLRGHGNWCGPGWTAGQWKDSKDLTDEDRLVPAVDALDAICKEHDIGLHDFPDKANELNKAFAEKASALGIKGKLFATLVSNFGPSPQMPTVPDWVDDEKKRKRGIFDQHQPQKFQKMSPTHIIPVDDDEDMGENNNTTTLAVAGARTSRLGGGGQKAYAETSVTYAQPTYGLQDTHTCIHPWNDYFSVICSTLDVAPVSYTLNTNSLYSIGTVKTAPTGGATYSAGLYSRPVAMDNTTSTWPTTFDSTVAFPSTNTGSPRPYWRQYFENLYSYYTVLRVHYRIVIDNANSGKFSSKDLVMQKIMVTEGAGGGTITPAPTNFDEALSIENSDFTTVAALGDTVRKSQKVIEGTWYPGMGRRDIINDDDAKTWTASTAVPSFQEYIKLFFWPGAHAMNEKGSAIQYCRANVSIHCKIVAQWKNLKLAARYPLTGATAITSVLPTDVVP